MLECLVSLLKTYTNLQPLWCFETALPVCRTGLLDDSRGGAGNTFVLYGWVAVLRLEGAG